MKRQIILSTAGILAVIASIITLAITLLAFSTAQISYGYRPGYVDGFSFFYVYYLATGILGVVSFVFGLASGILILRRRRLAVSVFGLCLLVACGVVMSYPLWFFGLPIIVLSVLSLILVAICRAEFTPKSIAKLCH